MRKLLYKSGTGISLALLSPAALAAPEVEQVVTNISYLIAFGSILFVVVVGVLVYFVKSRDKRHTPLNEIFEKGEAIHSVGPDTLVTECVRLMTAGKIGALIVMDGRRLIGIFTERDALNKVLAGGLDPGKTKVSEVMTAGPILHPANDDGWRRDGIDHQAASPAPADCGKRRGARRCIERRSNPLAGAGPDGRG